MFPQRESHPYVLAMLYTDCRTETKGKALPADIDIRRQRTTEGKGLGLDGRVWYSGYSNEFFRMNHRTHEEPNCPAFANSTLPKQK